MSPRAVTIFSFATLAFFVSVGQLRADEVPVIPATDSGTIMMVIDPLAETGTVVMERKKIAKSMTLSTEIDASEQSSFEAMLKSVAKRAALRATCRSDLRKANKEQVWNLTLRCVRGDLQEQRADLSRDIEAVAKLTGVAEKTKTALTDALKKLQTVLATLVQAIDTGVFRTEDNLRDALTNLRAKYLAPVWKARAAVRSERRRALVGVMLIDMHRSSGSVLEPLSWNKARRCLRTQEEILAGRMAPETASGQTLTGCFHLLHTAIELQVPTASGSTK
jgi:hypothetical protein